MNLSFSGVSADMNSKCQSKIHRRTQGLRAATQTWGFAGAQPLRRSARFRLPLARAKAMLVGGACALILPVSAEAACTLTGNQLFVFSDETARASGPADGTARASYIANSGGRWLEYRVGDVRTCTATFKQTLTINGSVVPGVTYQGRTVFDSGIPGIGFTVNFYPYYWNADGGGGGSEVYARDRISVIRDVNTSAASSMQYGVSGMYIDWIVTGRIPPGTYRRPTRLLATFSHTGSGIPGRIDVPVFADLVLTSTTTGCQITSGNGLAVTLPRIASAMLKEVGSVSADSTPFSMGIQCDAGVSVYAAMTDVSNPANLGDVLGLSGASTAQGVGLKLYRNSESAALKFGPDSSAKGTANQWFVGKSAASGKTTFTLPFTARYVKTAPKITPGEVYAGSTITFSYQ